MVLSFIILDIRGVQKFKMAAWKPEIHISQLVDKIETPFKGYPPLTELPKELLYPENEG